MIFNESKSLSQMNLELYRIGGAGLLEAHHNHSPSHALMEIYPDTEWQLWRFGRAPHNFWENLDNQRSYLQWLEDEWKIDCPSDWYFFTKDQVSAYMGGALINQYGSLGNLLKFHYPNFEWDLDRFRTNFVSISKGHLYACKLLKIIFNNKRVDSIHDEGDLFNGEEDVEIITNHDLTFLGRYSHNPAIMQLDIWIPKYNMCFEYQGIQHYRPINFLVDLR
jgi:hypothetical protein